MICSRPAYGMRSAHSPSRRSTHSPTWAELPAASSSSTKVGAVPPAFGDDEVNMAANPVLGHAALLRIGAKPAAAGAGFSSAAYLAFPAPHPARTHAATLGLAKPPMASGDKPAAGKVKISVGIVPELVRGSL
jgi:hypothetical protein